MKIIDKLVSDRVIEVEDKEENGVQITVKNVGIGR